MKVNTFLKPPPCDFSFPSGHTSAAFVSALVLGMLFTGPFSTVLIIFALIVGISRVYLGVHYPSDVIVGILIALISFAMVLNVLPGIIF
jgi:undecaprenyl-diphosphatase